MIIEQDKKQITTNIQSSSSFKIQASSKAFQILSSNIYKNKIRAVIREISCNAYDAHVASGVTQKFKVHLPTYLEKWFSVRDYGSGIPEEKMEEIYTTYFYSDKCNNNDLIGGLGLGTKSPMCLVDSFTVINYNNGYKMFYTCFKNENDEPQISLISKTPTDEPSGIEVIVHTGDNFTPFDFEYEAIEVFKFFEEILEINSLSVLEKIENQKNQMSWVEDFCISNDKNLYVVMGNVCYKSTISATEYGLHYGGYIRANIGDVNFDPGREYISLDKKTEAFLKEKCISIVKNMEKAIEKQLDSIECSYERAKTYLDKYESIKSPRMYNKYVPTFSNYSKLSKSYGRYHTTNSSRLYYKDAVYCYSPTNKYHEKKMKHILSSENVKHVCKINDEIYNSGHIPKELIIDLDSYRIPKNSTASNSIVSRSQSLLGKVYVFETNSTCISSTIRKNLTKQVDISSVPANERYCVKFSADSVFGFGSFDSFCQCIKQARDLGLNIPDKLYFVHHITYDSKNFAKSNSLLFNDYLKDQCVNLESSDFFIDKVSEVEKFLETLKSIDKNNNMIQDDIKKIESCLKLTKNWNLYYFCGKINKQSYLSSESERISKKLRSMKDIFKLVELTQLTKEQIRVIRSYL